MSPNSSGQSNQPFDFQKENKYLKMTISALRDQMEKIEIVQAEKIQKTKSESANEILQLQTIM